MGEWSSGQVTWWVNWTLLLLRQHVAAGGLPLVVGAASAWGADGGAGAEARGRRRPAEVGEVSPEAGVVVGEAVAPAAEQVAVDLRLLELGPGPPVLEPHLHLPRAQPHTPRQLLLLPLMDPSIDRLYISRWTESRHDQIQTWKERWRGCAYVREDVVGAEAVLEHGGLRGGEPELLPAAAAVIAARRLGLLALMTISSGGGATTCGGCVSLLLPACCRRPAPLVVMKCLRFVTVTIIVLHRQNLAEQLHRPRRRRRR